MVSPYPLISSVAHGKPGDVKSCITPVTYIYVFWDLAYLELFILCLTLISYGWYITRTSFYGHEKRTTTWNLFWLAICKLLLIWSEYFIFPLLVMYVVVYARILGSMMQNVSALNIHMLVYRDETYRSSPGYKKIVLFRYLQVIIGSYVFSQLSVFLILFFGVYQTTPRFITDLLWVRIIIQELVELVFYLAIGVVLRMRNFQTTENAFSNTTVTSTTNTEKPVIIIENNFSHRVYSIGNLL